MVAAAAELSPTFDTPFYVGSASGTSADVPYLFQVGINGRGYMIDFDSGLYKRDTLPVTRTPTDDTAEPGEHSLNTEGLWRRSQENWVLGAGQEHQDNRASQTELFTRNGQNGSIRYRFWKSKNADVFSHEGQLTLLRDTELKFADASTNQQVLAVGERLYYTNGTVVTYTDDPTLPADTIAYTTVGLGGKTPVSLASDGTTIWIACTDSVRSSAAGSNTSANVVALGAAPSKIAYCNGRLVVAVANQLSEVTRAGALVGIGSPSNNNPGFIYTDIIGAPNTIYACGYAGNHGEVYSIGVDATTGALNTPIFAAGLPYGETPNTLAAYGGLVIIGTSQGIRIAELSGSADTLFYGPVIDDFGACKCLDPFGEYCWFGTGDYYTVPSTDPTGTPYLASGLARLALSRYTSSLVPAYAVDVKAPDHTVGAVLSVCNIDGRRYFTVVSSGVFGETANYAADGFAQSGFIRYGTVEPKTVVGVDWRQDPLPAGATVGMVVMKEDGSALPVAESILTSSLGPSPLDTTLSAGESFKAHVYLKRATTPTAAPVVRRWTIRSLVTPQRMEEIIVPLRIRTRVETLGGEGQYQYLDVLDEYHFLSGLATSGEVVVYQEGSSATRVYVDRVEVRPEKWKDDRSFFEGLIVVRLLTIGG